MSDGNNIGNTAYVVDSRALVTAILAAAGAGFMVANYIGTAQSEPDAKTCDHNYAILLQRIEGIGKRQDRISAAIDEWESDHRQAEKDRQANQLRLETKILELQASQNRG